MLVLRRCRGEVIAIGEAHIIIKEITENWVEIAIDAPPGLPISHRDEGPALAERLNETAA